MSTQKNLLMTKKLLNFIMIVSINFLFFENYAQGTFTDAEADGSGKFLWSNTNNWSGGVVPGTGEIAIIAGNPTIDAPATVGSLLMGGSGDYTILGEVGNVLTLDAASPIKNTMNALLTIDVM